MPVKEWGVEAGWRLRTVHGEEKSVIGGLQENLGDKDSRKGQGGNLSLELGCPGTTLQLYGDSRGLTPSRNLGFSNILSITPEPWAGPVKGRRHFTAQPLNFGTLESYNSLQSTFAYLKTRELISATLVLTHCR